eukprot:TRINITY_DN1191_c0_g1_i4.p1 TRINITY_DN1191_c0_g1~~TRINITY_DN1191_c0_g1_i4.p1  ORF type:complete len:746 (+),score=268.94 TRINITY_DN1191_c0_g1_i4:41-2278(+)
MPATYGRALKEYDMDELKELLVKEEERLRELKSALHERHTAKSGHGRVKTDKKGVMTRVFTAKEKQAVKEVFDRIDTDKSGDLTLDELAKVVEELDCDMDEEEVKSALVELDTDQNGTVNWEEFFTWWSSDINRSRYKGGALARLKGRISAQENSSIGLSGLRLSIDPTKEVAKAEVASSVEMGDYSTKDATFLRFDVVPGSGEEFRAAGSACSTEGCSWICNPSKLSHALWRPYKHSKGEYVAVAKVSYEVLDGKKDTVEKVYNKAIAEYSKACQNNADENLEGMEEVSIAALTKHKVLKDGKVQLDEMWKQCNRLGEYLNVVYEDENEEVVTDKPTTLEEGSDDCKLLTALVELLEADEGDEFFPSININITDSEVVVTTVMYISKSLHDTGVEYITSLVGNDIEAYVKKALGELSLTLGLGGNFSGHVRNVLEKDAKLLDMLGWGFLLDFKASYVPTILESLLSTVQKGEVLLPSFMASLFQKFTSRVKVRNPYAKMEEIVDYLVADARCTFVAHAGVDDEGEGYNWDKEAEEQLKEIRQWGHFFLRSIQEKARLSTEMPSHYLVKLCKKVQGSMKESPYDEVEINGWEMLQNLKGALGKLKGATVNSPYAKLTVGIEGEVAPLEFIPSDNVIKEIVEGKRVSAGDPKHQEECERRFNELKNSIDDEDEGYVNQHFSQVKLAMEAIEESRGGRVMARKDGLLFVTFIVKVLSEMRIPVPFADCGQEALLVLLGQNVSFDDDN